MELMLHMWSCLKEAVDTLYPLFCQVVDCSLRTGLAALVIWILRRSVLKKMPKKICCWLWLLLFLRLLFPFSFESSWQFPITGPSLSLTEDILPDEAGRDPLLAEAEKEDTKNAADSKGSMSGALLAGTEGKTGNTGQEAGVKGRMPGYGSVTAKFLASFSLKETVPFLPAVWLLGMVLLFGSMLIRGARLKTGLRTAAGKPGTGGDVRISAGIAGPFIFGIFKPVIYLPPGLSEEEEEMILAHERAHLKRKDPLVKLACFTAAAIHWFNPLAWLSFRLMTRDMEMACDEQALADAKKDIRVAYSRVLLSVSVKRSGLLLPVSFGESDTKRRVKNVLRRPHMTPGRWGIALVILAAVGAAFLLSGIRTKNTAGSGPLPVPAETQTAQETASGEESCGEEKEDNQTEKKRQSLTEEKERLQKEIAGITGELEAWKLQMDALLEQMEKAPEDEKEEWILRYNKKAEGQQELYNQLAGLETEQKMVKDQLLELDIWEATGRNLVQEERERLEALPEDLHADNASEYGIYVSPATGEKDTLRQALWNFYVNTGFGKGTLPSVPYQPEPLESADLAEDAVSTKVVAQTILIGQLTTEGDMILISVKCWGKGYLILTDQSRDKWKETDTEDITVSHAGYLNWLRDEETGAENVVASDLGNLTYKQLSESMLRSNMEAHIPYTFLAWFS